MAAYILTGNRLKGEGMLLLAALIWGSSYLFQKSGMDYVGPLTFGFFRFAIGAVVLIPVIIISDRRKSRTTRSHKIADKNPHTGKALLTGGVVIGITNFAGATFQQVGLIYTTTGKAGFITSMDVIFVPVILLIFFRKSTNATTWISVLTACVGLYLLCMTDSFSLQPGDSLVMLCAFFYALQIISIDYYVDSADPLKLAFVEFAFTAVLSGILMFIFENPSLSGIYSCAVPLLYTGILEVGCAFTLEILGQKYVTPAVAAVLMSFEAVFAALFGMIFLGEIMSVHEIAGCVIMLAAILVSQLSSVEK